MPMPLICSLVGFALEGGASSDIIEIINVSEVNDLKQSTNFQPSGGVASGQKICRFIFIKAPSYLSLSGLAIIVAEVPALNLITDPYADFSKDADGHNALKGDS